MKRPPLVFAMGIVVTLLAVSGCGSASSTANPSNSSASAAPNTVLTQFVAEETPDIQVVNMDFSKESELIKEMSTNQISYASFKSSYLTDEAQAEQEISKISDASAPAGAIAYQQDYVTLLKEGTKVFSDQEKAILPNGSVDPAKAKVLRQELNTFVQDSQALTAKYHIS